MSSNVLAFKNAGEWFYVADDVIDARAAADDDREFSAGQCEACGSFDPATGEPGRGFVIEETREYGSGLMAVCPCCGDRRRVRWIAEDEVVFP